MNLLLAASARRDSLVRGTSVPTLTSYLNLDRNRGRPGAGQLRRLVAMRTPGRPIASEAETKLFRVLRRHGSWKPAVVLAVVLIGVFVSIGLLSRSSPVPPPGAVGAKAALTTPTTPATIVSVSLSSDKPVLGVVVTVDGAPGFSGTIQPDKRLSFQSTGLIHVWIPVGGAVDVVANGHDLGKLGDRKSPFEWSFKPQDFRGTPSANGP